MSFIKISEKKRFVIKYAFRAVLSLLLIAGGFLLFKELYFDHDPEYWIDKFYGNNLKIQLIYVASELFFGIFPPEIFMVWAINAGDTTSYVINILFFALVSMAAGHIAFWGGRYLSKVFGKRFKRSNFIAQYLPFVKKFGGLIILIAAITPLPWATISLVMGSIEYSYRNYTLFGLARILRFVLNGFLIFQTGSYFI